MVSKTLNSMQTATMMMILTAELRNLLIKSLLMGHSISIKRTQLTIETFALHSNMDLVSFQ